MGSEEVSKAGDPVDNDAAGAASGGGGGGAGAGDGGGAPVAEEKKGGGGGGGGDVVKPSAEGSADKGGEESAAVEAVAPASNGAGANGTHAPEKKTAAAPKPPVRGAAGGEATVQFRSRDEKNRCRLFIGNLASERTSKEEVRSLFEQYGRILDISFHPNYGFVQFDNANSVLAAINNSQGLDIGGKAVDLQCSGATSGGSSDRRPSGPPAPPRDPYSAAASMAAGLTGDRPSLRFHRRLIMAAAAPVVAVANGTPIEEMIRTLDVEIGVLAEAGTVEVLTVTAVVAVGMGSVEAEELAPVEAGQGLVRALSLGQGMAT
ncbi:RNA-binding protein 4 (Lark homolog) (hLark) (RNA-binding motif protein 4) (RNA-binding motif protein 4a) [Durusdinium trenchii]|uniref:RNA-binding protein 4 (Lark homolog) (HLark) (RNA-binding motif protein 4) (RNA-binding motif protein 4a) n=1 Tax=Durusdinium trenchii TaxID=1381693 RepID=A0ABP0JC01_9DINO